MIPPPLSLSSKISDEVSSSPVIQARLHEKGSWFKRVLRFSIQHEASRMLNTVHSVSGKGRAVCNPASHVIFSVEQNSSTSGVSNEEWYPRISDVSNA